MAQYTNINSMPGIPAGKLWTRDGTSDFYAPPPTEVLLWRGGMFQTDEEATVGEIPDQYKIHKLWVENMPLEFEEVV